jgi:hypothetical protein
MTHGNSLSISVPKEAQLKQAQLGITMSAYTGTSDAWKNSVPQFNLQAYLDMQKDMVIRPYSREHSQMGKRDQRLHA